MAEAIGHIAPPSAPVRPEAKQPAPAPVQTAAPRDVKLATAAQADIRQESEMSGKYTTLDNTKLTVSLDAETGTYIYKSVNSDDGETVWQWPSEQVMRVIQYFRRIESLEEKLAAKRAVDQKA
jgi:uncharacterized FlaG/YvyC family protein